MDPYTANYPHLDQLVDLSTEPTAYLAVVFTIIAFLSILLRAWAQWGTDRAWSVVLLLAMIFVVAGCALNLAMLRYDLGKEGLRISIGRLILILKFAFAIGITYSLALCLAKLAILEMYLKLFTVHRTRMWIMVLAALSVAACAANIFVIIFQCKPIERAWNITSTGHCIYIQGAYTGFGIVNIVLDVLIPIVPAFGVAKLQGDVSRRTVAIIMLVLGSSVVVVSSVRLYYFFKTKGRVPPDEDTARLIVLSTIEAALAVTSSCLPLLKPLFLKAATKFRPNDSRSQATISTPDLGFARASHEKDAQRSLTASHVTSTHSAETEAPVRQRPGQLD